MLAEIVAAVLVLVMLAWAREEGLKTIGKGKRVEPFSPSTPLVALEAVAVDTETTGLDERNARVVQLGAVKLLGGKILRGGRFDVLINPGIPIPPLSSAIHGIRDTDVAEAAPFSTVWPAFQDFAGGLPLIGYRTGFDVAVLRRECRLAGASWPERPQLCVRVLSRIAAPPSLANTSLENLCAWLGITIEGRHTALGDAIAAAKVWAKLIPLLRKKGIRTVGEAISAGAEMIASETRETSLLAASETDMPPLSNDQPNLRIDSYPYRHRVSHVMSAPVVFVDQQATIQQAARLLAEQRVSSALIDAEGGVGIITERDLLRAFAVLEPSSPEIRVTELMSRPLHTISEDSYLYRAVGRMSRLGVRHLAVTDALGKVVGMITPRSLLRERATEAIILGDEIETARNGAALAVARAKLNTVATSLLAEDVDASAITAIISGEVCALTKRAAEIAERRMKSEGRGNPPVRYAVLVLGSGGRGESVLAPDQDNAIVYERGAPGGPEDVWFAEMAGHMADLLDEAGVPYCKGGVMARNSAWRKSLEDWHATIDGWIRRSRPQDLLNVDIFFDGVAVHGDAALGEELWRHACLQAHGSVVFQKLMTELARDWRSPVGFFGSFRADKGDRTDLKMGGLMPIFTGARVLSIKHDVLARSTSHRLRGAAVAGAMSTDAAETIIAAHQTILAAILGQQLEDARKGVPLSNCVAVGSMSSRHKRRLRQAVKDIDILTDIIGEARL